MTSMSIILTVFVLQLHHVGPHKRRVPRWLRTLIFDILARLVCLSYSARTLRRNNHIRSNKRAEAEAMGYKIQEVCVPGSDNPASVHTTETFSRTSGTISDIRDRATVLGGSHMQTRDFNNSVCDEELGSLLTSSPYTESERRKFKRGNLRNCNGDALQQRLPGNNDRVAPSVMEHHIIGFRPQDSGYDISAHSQSAKYDGPASSSHSQAIRYGAGQSHYDLTRSDSSRYDNQTPRYGHHSTGGVSEQNRGSFRGFRHTPAGEKELGLTCHYMPSQSDYDNDRDYSRLQSNIEYDRYQALVTEWQFVAHVMDRVLFWMFLFVAVVSSLAILVIKPLFKPPV